MEYLKASEEKCGLASARIESNVRDLEEEMDKGDVELINLAIDGLKQVKLILSDSEVLVNLIWVVFCLRLAVSSNQTWIRNFQVACKQRKAVFRQMGASLLGV